MNSAWVTTNILDMRSQPNHHAERVNQLLFGDLVEWSTERKGFAYVRRWDGYRGWTDTRFLAPISGRRATGYRRQPMVVVTALQARLVDSHSRRVVPYVLYYGTTLALNRIDGKNAELVTPDGGLVRIKASRTRPIMDNNRGPLSGRDLVREAGKFVGVPYLWGGITSPGLDCSGLVQTVCRRFGRNLPRDTKDQIRTGSRIERARIRSGDLMFFPGHVGIAIGRDRLIHSSRGGGGVRIESLAQEVPAYRSDLDKSYMEARRIV